MTSSDTNQPKSPKEKRPFVTFETDVSDQKVPTTVSRMKSESSLAKKKPQEEVLQNAVVANQVASR